jgi:prepilin-type N-terminal cleavage/methylation domain-containing protein
MDQKTIDCRSVGKGIWAFTLIELLVVVAIIAVLVAILLPAIQKARKQTKILTCGTQMRQIGVALYTYAGENQDFFPPYYKNPNDPSDCSLGSMDWRDLPGPLDKAGILRAPATYYCPDGCTWDVAYPRSVGWMMGYYVRWGIFTKRYSLRDPSGIVLVTEPCGWWGGGAWSHAPHRGYQEDSGFNCLYLDGSVYYIKNVPDWLASGLGAVGNYWEPFDRNEFDRSWYTVKGGEYNP